MSKLNNLLKYMSKLNLGLLNPLVLDYMIDLCCITWNWTMLVSSQHTLHMVELRENKCVILCFVFFCFLRKGENLIV